MKSTPTIRGIVYYSLYASQWLAGGLVALLTFAATQDPAKYNNLQSVVGIISWSKTNKAVTFALAAVAVVTKFATERMGPPWAWKAIKDLIDIWQKLLVAGINNPSTTDHRVTLFKRVPRWRTLRRWRTLKEGSDLKSYFDFKDWPIGWFKPVARSRHVGQRNVSWFPCYDNAHIGEGVIGVVWRTDGIIRVTLPDLDPAPPNPPATDKDYTAYAAQARVTEKWLKSRNGKMNPLYLCGTKIERSGKDWGVIIIDSRNPQLNVTNDQMKFAAAALGKFIERA